jgi:peptidoglycan hydrolase CwlO-like protein
MLVMSNELLLLISNVMTATASFFVGRRKMNAESDNQILRNLELSINIYAELVKNLKEEIESLNIKIQQLETKMDDLYRENKELKYGKSI